MTAHLTCENLCLSYGKTPVLTDVNLDLVPGQITAIVGPNGCGKSSLLRCLSRVQSPTKGQVLLDGEPIHKQNTKQVARKIAFMPQSATAPTGMRIMDLVLRGRTPHQSPLQQWTSEDQRIVERALDQVGLTHRAHELLEDLSGGQLQRAWIAMVLAQDTEILLLDEPTTFLDLAHQQDILKLVRELQADRGLTVAMVLHDINLASRFTDNIIALRDQNVLCSGVPQDVITEPNIQDIYGLACSVIADPHHGLPHIILK
ncbi:iron complex transport system ATP-binding protein [Aliiroseovarius halocynthiae]|uniref:ABC transporter ATP-binding protein n=1 Tax=Aliiroseovarius halocynthiae TaxID=985055 RepID=A0A545SLB4_9RHOB|nr:ABC transporter ATP-binding protein [Aliiroseovarius halocynthiae]TQV65774.1 ABC transporter ATP-binding protein [Aliiroseovarius halocynthiae]SMR83541.1 iron complex transport system ATP-binding protein [Aliiroseovarius halocynthiae]